MKFKITLLFLIFQIVFIFSQKIDLEKSVLVIPNNLTENANLVTRYYYTDVNVTSKKNMTITYKKLITVLNKHGNKAFFVENYNKYTSISNININIYDKLGKLIKKVKKKEIEDVASSTNNYTLFSDERYKYYKHIPNEYPYSIEVSYTIKTSNTAFIPKWYVCDSYFQSLQKEKYTITYPKNLTLNYKEANFKNYSIEKKEEENKLLFSIENFKTIIEEPYAPLFSQVVPNVQFALNQFSLAGESGNATSWEKFGQWMNEKLLKGRNEISDQTKNDIKQLVKGISNPIERAKLVYEYMQNRTRYISIQIGIGGWKPMLAKDVDKLRYGDCKALSYYTKTLLDEANVKSEYTIVYAGDKKNIAKDLVSVQGNHAILMVPNVKDTIWLECTSQKLPFGQTGATDDRDVLVITNNKGKIVHTNKYDSTQNIQKIIGTIHIDNNGNMVSEIEIESLGKQYNDHYGVLYKEKKEQVKYYKNVFSNLIDAKINKIEFKNNKNQIVFKEKLMLSVPKYAELIGDDMMLKLNAFNVYNDLPKRIVDRKLPLLIKFGYIDNDEIVITIPNGYKIDILPKKIVINNKFGSYKASVIKKGNKKLLYKRSLQINEAKFTKNEYNNYRNFIKKIIKHDKQKIIISKI